MQILAHELAVLVGVSEAEIIVPRKTVVFGATCSVRVRRLDALIEWRCHF